MKYFILPIFLIFTMNSFAAIDLIGGKDAGKDEFRSTVYIKGSCTATKIAKRAFLLAAHCVINFKNAEIKHKYNGTGKIKIETHYGASYKLKVIGAFAHESYVSKFKDKMGSNSSKFVTGLNAFDIAVVTVNEDSPKIPVATIGLEYVKEGQSVTIGGYGCEDKVGSSFNFYKPNYKISTTVVVGSKEISFDYHHRDNSRVMDFNFLTKGLGMDKSTASICPGDSGGPVYRRSDNALIGVNSYYIFKDSSGISLINLHTRISEVSEWVKTFLD
jgi:hypothetical protein